MKRWKKCFADEVEYKNSVLRYILSESLDGLKQLIAFSILTFPFVGKRNFRNFSCEEVIRFEGLLSWNFFFLILPMELKIKIHWAVWKYWRNYCDKFRIVYIPFYIYILKKISHGNCPRCWQSHDKNVPTQRSQE